MSRPRPYVLLSAAVSLDGYLDDSLPRRLVLSSEEDFDEVDELRAGVDAILVGAGTVRADNPSLLVRSRRRQLERTRLGKPANPVKVTLSASGELDPSAAFFTEGQAERLVYLPDPSVASARVGLGAVATLVGAGSPLDLSSVLADLSARGVERLMVEGGGKVHTQFLIADLADELRLAVAPFFVGDPAAPRLVGPGGFPQNVDRPMRLVEARGLGGVVVLRYLAR